MTAEMQTTILLYESEAHDLEAQIVRENMSKNLKHKMSSIKISEILDKFGQEKTKVRNQIRSLDAKDSSDEYRNLMTELEEIKDEEDRARTAEEEAATDYENTIQLHIDQDQTRLEAVRADLEQMKETNQDNVKKQFSYFQN